MAKTPGTVRQVSVSIDCVTMCPDFWKFVSIKFQSNLCYPIWEFRKSCC